MPNTVLGSNTFFGVWLMSSIIAIYLPWSIIACVSGVLCIVIEKKKKYGFLGLCLGVIQILWWISIFLWIGGTKLVYSL